MSQREATTRPEDLPGLDLVALRAHLEDVSPGLVSGPLRGSVIAGGRSNLTYDVTDGRYRWAVRRPPLGHVLATAHDMSREVTVLRALAGTSVPVPHVLTLHEQDGVPYYVMDFVEGTIYRHAAQSQQLGRERAQAISAHLVQVLADLHALEPAAVGLADFGRPDGYLERQVRRWSGQLAKSYSRELAEAEPLQQALAKALPASQRATVVHGDYRLDNLVVGTGDQVAAVLDWEMSTLGDPLTDLGLLAVYWGGVLPSGSVVASAVAPGSGFPSSEELLAAYAERSDLDLDPLPWYVAFAQYKLAVILEGIHFRYVQGKTVGAGFDRIGELVPPLLQAGLGTIEGWRTHARPNHPATDHPATDHPATNHPGTDHPGSTDPSRE